MLNRYFLVSLISFLLAPFSLANSQDAQTVYSESQQALNNLQTWDSAKLKVVLEKRIAENQHLLNFLSEHGHQLDSTEVDSTYDYDVNRLMTDQKALLFISENLAKIDTEEELKIDDYLSQQPRLNKEVEQTLNMNLGADNSRALVHRVLYYSLMDKYAVQ